jgi:nitrite reductase (NADH) small subunit
MTWLAVCPIDALVPDRGVAALVDGPVAVFLLSTGELYAVGNVDPCSGANVLSRGIVGDVDGSPTVASPMYKQRFDLRTGRCLDADVEPLRVHGVCTIDGVVHVRSWR